MPSKRGSRSSQIRWIRQKMVPKSDRFDEALPVLRRSNCACQGRQRDTENDAIEARQ